jgi:hypothetical protein
MTAGAGGLARPRAGERGEAAALALRERRPLVPHSVDGRRRRGGRRRDGRRGRGGGRRRRRRSRGTGRRRPGRKRLQRRAPPTPAPSTPPAPPRAHPSPRSPPPPPPRSTPRRWAHPPPPGSFAAAFCSRSSTRPSARRCQPPPWPRGRMSTSGIPAPRHQPQRLGGRIAAGEEAVLDGVPGRRTAPGGGLRHRADGRWGRREIGCRHHPSEAAGPLPRHQSTPLVEIANLALPWATDERSRAAAA